MRKRIYDKKREREEKFKNDYPQHRTYGLPGRPILRLSSLKVWKPTIFPFTPGILNKQIPAPLHEHVGGDVREGGDLFIGTAWNYRNSEGEESRMARTVRVWISKEALPMVLNGIETCFMRAQRDLKGKPATTEEQQEKIAEHMSRWLTEEDTHATREMKQMLESMSGKGKLCKTCMVVAVKTKRGFSELFDWDYLGMLDMVERKVNERMSLERMKIPEDRAEGN